MDRFQILKGEKPPQPPSQNLPDLIEVPKRFYRAKRGVTDRCGIIYSDPQNMFLGQMVHFFKNESGKFICFSCKKDRSRNWDQCCKKLGRPKWRIGVVLIKYRGYEYEILPWIFGETTYMHLKTMNNEFPLIEHDFFVTCSNEQYQQINLIPCQESQWQKYMSTAKIINEAKPVEAFLKKKSGDRSY